VEGEVVLRDEVRRALAAMTHLSDKDRTVIGLRIAAGLPYAEVGAVLGISEHAATMACKRALARLQRHLGVSG
jgi:RNA polymerase sigma factor (sigma-70 family)